MKERLDLVLVEKGFFSSRERARASIMAGTVFVDGQMIDKAGTKIDPASPIEVREEDLRYVSRGGLKLEKALASFPIDLEGKVCVDIGASTGGFTDCMLQNGAVRVYAIDVGYGQLDWKLRNDERVINIERTNVRYMDPETIPEKADFISIDVSFISLKLIFPVAAKLLKEDGQMVALIKPQFEAGKEEASRGKGIIRDPEIRERVIRGCMDYAEENGLVPYGLTVSPIKGAKGNIEFLLYVGKNENLRYNREGILDAVYKASEDHDL